MTKVTSTLQHAEKIAGRVGGLLLPHCIQDRFFFAGSIRRRKAFVGDIEIVCNFEKNMLHKFALAVYSNFGVGVKADSRQLKFGADSMQVDLFIPQHHDFFRQLVIRTGSAEYVHKVIATGWNKLGWCGTPDGLRRIDQCERVSAGRVGLVEKFKWNCKVVSPELPPVWNSEKEFFDWLQIKYCLPENRN